MFALEKDDAFKRLRGDDPRPLLVMRECNMCKGTDDALLSRTLSNERTLILARWFHCVKLKHHVLKKDHTFNQLFTGKRPPHLFLASADGSNMSALPGDQTQSDLWKSMHAMLKIEYEGDAERAVREIFKVLAAYDDLDARGDQLREQIETEIEKRGPKSSKLKKLNQKLARLEAKKKDAMEREDRASKLQLRAREADPEPTK